MSSDLHLAWNFPEDIQEFPPNLKASVGSVVLHVGGTIVLLLNNDHHRRLQDCEQSGIPLNSKGSPTDEPGIEKCLSPREKTDLSDTVSSSSEASSQGGLDKMPPVGSLVPVECYQVSLGRTEAFICKYRKSHSLGL